MYPEPQQLEPAPSFWRVHRSWYIGIFILVAIIFIALLFIANANFAEEYERSQMGNSVQVKKAEPIKITIDLGDGKQPRIFAGHHMPDLTLGDALVEISGIAGYKVLSTNDSLTSLTGKVTGKAKPVLYVNGTRYGLVELTLPLTSGDNLLIRYEVASF